MALSIEMTVRGVLVAGNWKTQAELNQMTTDEKRNTLIVALTTVTNQTAAYFQGFGDDALVGKAAVAVFIREAGLRDNPWLKRKSDDDQRNTLIVSLNQRTDRPVPQLQGKNNQELVVLGLEWFNGAAMVTGILDFSWQPDNAKILATVPDVIREESFLNSSKNDPLDGDFSFEKSVTNTSTFSHEHGFTVKIGVETTFTAGIPFFAKNETTVKIDAGTSNTWKFGEENITTQKYVYTSVFKVPPQHNIKRTATITRSSLTVPYRATVLTGDGSKRVMEGTWNGVSTYNLIVTQEDLDTVNLKVQRETLQIVDVNPKSFPEE